MRKSNGSLPGSKLSEGNLSFFRGFSENVNREEIQDEDLSFEDESWRESPLQWAISAGWPPCHQMDPIHPRLPGAHGDSKYSALVWWQLLSSCNFIFYPCFSLFSITVVLSVPACMQVRACAQIVFVHKPVCTAHTSWSNFLGTRIKRVRRPVQPCHVQSCIFLVFLSHSCTSMWQTCNLLGCKDWRLHIEQFCLLNMKKYFCWRCNSVISLNWIISLLPNAGRPPKFDYFGQFPGIKVVGIDVSFSRRRMRHIKSGAKKWSHWIGNMELMIIPHIRQQGCAIHGRVGGAQSECVGFCQWQRTPVIDPSLPSLLVLLTLIAFLLRRLLGNCLFLEQLPVQRLKWDDTITRMGSKS